MQNYNRHFLHFTDSSKKTGGAVSAENLQHFLTQSYQDEPSEIIGDFVLDRNLSTPTAKVYTNPDTKQTIVAHRGTKGAWDWGNNLAYATGLYDYTDRYKQGKKVQEEAEKKYGAQNISTLGHSQGAVLSRKLGKNTKEIINVNPAYTLEVPKSNEYNVRSSADIVSKLYEPVQQLQDLFYPSYSKKHNITIPAQSRLNILGEHKPSILSRLDPTRMIGGNEPIDFEDVDWGSFTKTFKNFKAKNKYPDNLHQFAELVLKYKDHFSKKTLKRARFYINVLSKHH